MPRKKQVSEPVSPKIIRDYAIPGCTVEIRSEDSSTPDQLFAIALQLVHSNPDAKVDFWIGIRN